jgi:hypothetical protein
MSPYLNDGSNDAPKLRIWLNLDNLADLRPGSLWPAGLETRPAERDARLAADGFEGVQVTDTSAASSNVLPYCGLDRISVPDDADPVFAKHVDRGDLCLTVHAGWGWEDDLEAGRLVEAVLNASQRHQLPVFVETHRATLTQDVWRTVQLLRAFPELRLNGDFSHYYCGQEMIYGDWEARMEFMAPIFKSIGFMHGRIASSGCMQAGIGTDWNARPALAYGHADYLTHFRDLWTRAMRGFLQSAGPGDVLVFAPELLSGAYYYARMFLDSEGTLVEEHDRYAQALIYQNLARECFAAEKLTEAQSLT